MNHETITRSADQNMYFDAFTYLWTSTVTSPSVVMGVMKIRAPSGAGLFIQLKRLQVFSQVLGKERCLRMVAGLTSDHLIPAAVRAQLHEININIVNQTCRDNAKKARVKPYVCIIPTCSGEETFCSLPCCSSFCTGPQQFLPGRTVCLQDCNLAAQMDAEYIVLLEFYHGRAGYLTWQHFHTCLLG